MPAGLKPNERNRALRALDDAKAILQRTSADVDAEALKVIEQAGERIQQANAAFVLALLKDDYCPAKLFAPWASVRRVRDWGADGKIRVIIRHKRACVRPSDFFAYWATLP